MVKVMTILQPSAVGGDFGDQGRFDAMAQGADWSSKVSEGHQIPMNPSSCTFWCAIALGALVKGRPIESGTKYSQLAHEALAKSNSGPADAEVAKFLCFRRSTISSILQENYQQYLALSETYVKSVRKHGSTDALPVVSVPLRSMRAQMLTKGFSEVVTYAEISDSCCEQRLIKSFLADEESIFQAFST
ncbi:unnamed protein product [Ectocarpus sp. CCAP 1310/34]|nr:unnamed protein product [Ectocarpus sp. CCAP 1310/34]